MNNKQLRDVSKRISSYSLPRRKETKEFTGFKYIHYGDIHTKVANIINEDDNLPNIEVGKYEVLKKYDIVVADASEDYQGIGQPAIVLFEPRNNIVAGLHTYAIRPDLEKVDALYLFYLIKSQKFKRYGYKVGTGMKVFGINVDNFMNFSHTYPSKEKQTQIGIFFKELDELIELQQVTISSLKKIKKRFLQEFFSLEKVFEFKKSKIKDLIVENKEKSELNNQYPILTSSRNGIYLQSEYFERNVASKNNIGYSIVPRNAFTYRSVSDDDNFKFNMNTLIDKGLVSPLYPVFFALNEEDIYYLYYALNNSSEIKKQIRESKQGGTRTSLTLNNLRNMSISLPDKKERKDIGCFFNNFDKLIELENNELELLQEMKKGFLQKMFV